MALIEQEELLFALQDAEMPHTVTLSGSEGDDYDDDPEEEGGQQQQPPPPPQQEGEQQPDTEEATDASVAKIVKPKRIIRNPRPKLDVARLCGPRGIGIVQKWLSGGPYRGKGHETEDLGLLLQKLQHWAHRLYPKLPFLDTLTQIEKLGNKKPLQVNVKKLRMDMYDTPVEGSDEVVDAVAGVGDDDAAGGGDNDEPDVFDELLRQSGAPSGLHTRVTGAAETDDVIAPVPSSQPPAAPPLVLTAEQRARIERNKQQAMQRRQAKLAAQLLASTAASDDGVIGAASVTSSNTTDVSTLTVSGESNETTGSSKRKRGAGDDSDDEEVLHPTQEQLRTLREGLLNNVQSQISTGAGNPSQESDGNRDEFDEFDDMDVDDVLSALNKAEAVVGEVNNDAFVNDPNNSADMLHLSVQSNTAAAIEESVPDNNSSMTSTDKCALPALQSLDGNTDQEGNTSEETSLKLVDEERPDETVRGNADFEVNTGDGLDVNNPAVNNEENIDANEDIVVESDASDEKRAEIIPDGVQNNVVDDDESSSLPEITQPTGSNAPQDADQLDSCNDREDELDISR